MSAGAGAARPVVLRQTSAVLVPVAVWIFCGLALADAVVEGTTGYALTVALVMATIAHATWMGLASPCLVVEAEGLRIVNPLHIHEVPFAALVSVQVRGLTSVTALDRSGGTRAITSWNAPGVPRQFEAATAPAADVIERARATWEERRRGSAEPGVVTTSWRWRPAAVLLILLAGNISIWLR